MSNLYTPQAVGEILNVTDVCLCLWRRDGVGPAWRKHGHLVYYPANKFKEYLDRIGPVPAGMSTYEKGKFFTRAHRPEVVSESAVIAKLAARVTSLERKLAKLTANTPKRRKRRGASDPRSSERKHLRAGERVLTAKVLRKLTQGVMPAE